MERLPPKHDREPHVTLERATADDVDTFLEIEKSAEGSRTYSATTNREEALAELQNCIVSFIREDGRLVGSISYKIESPNHAELSILVILPEARGRGLGRKAMAQVMKKLEHVPIVSLTVHPNNPAVDLYESFGFVAEKSLENHYGDGEPRVVMARRK